MVRIERNCTKDLKREQYTHYFQFSIYFYNHKFILFLLCESDRTSGWVACLSLDNWAMLKKKAFRKPERILKFLSKVIYQFSVEYSVLREGSMSRISRSSASCSSHSCPLSLVVSWTVQKLEWRKMSLESKIQNRPLVPHIQNRPPVSQIQNRPLVFKIQNRPLVSKIWHRPLVF